MKIQSKQLTAELEQQVIQIIGQTNALAALPSEVLLRQPAPGKWSIAQVLEHLNSYNRYYLLEIEHALQQGRKKGIAASAAYTPGWFGNYFTKMMQPGADNVIAKKYKAPQDHTPVANLDPQQVIREFIEGENRLIDFLQQGAKSDLGKVKVPISISRMIRLKLGDTFRFLIAHQRRHFVQIRQIA